MRRYHLSQWLSLLLLVTFAISERSVATDWPQWRGPNRDGISQETGILKNWPNDGPNVIWKAPAGDGYSAMSVVDGRLYTMYGTGDDEVAVCLDANTGEQLWRFRMDSKFEEYWGHGTRATPTVDGNVVYVISAKSKLYALDAKTGKEIWGHDLVKKFDAQVPRWGTATSPLVYGEQLIVDVGGSGDYGIVSFNKKNGEVIWNTPTELPGYSSPIAVDVGGVKQILCFTGKALISVSPEDGRKFWSHRWITSYDVNAATPIFVEPDKVFISSGYDVGCALLKMIPQNGDVKVEELYSSREMRNQFTTCVLIDGHVYGFDEGTLKCMDVRTQETKWAERGLGKGSLLYADGHLIVMGERGQLVLVEATPKQYVQKAKAQMLEGRTWTMPTLANGKLYIRNQEEILCLNFAAK